ncbi:MAG: ATP-grasp domain-containing protein [Pseudomonadota bacterium]
MNLHEYQSKSLFNDYGIPILPGLPADSVEKAKANAESLGGNAWLVKAQVHAGGRGKAGGVKFAKSVEEVGEAAGALLGTQLITKQSAPDGQPVNIILVDSAAEIAHELYLGAVVDRGSRTITFMASRAGGMDIEEVAAETPEKIVTVSVDPVLGLQNYQCRQMGFFLDMNSDQIKQLGKILHGLYRLFTEKDLSLVEINPLAILGKITRHRSIKSFMLI